jgi:hypothetical protein
MAGYVNLHDAATVRRVLRAAHMLLRDRRYIGIQGFAVGSKTVDGRAGNQAVLHVLVDQLRNPKQSGAPPIPSGGVVDAGGFLQDDSFAGSLLVLDVQAVGKLSPQAAVAPIALSPVASLRTGVRPAFPGASIAHAALPGAGTLGACLRDAAGNLYVLSNNHVLALETGILDGVGVGGRFGMAALRDQITQPGAEPPRRRSAADILAELADFVPLNFEGIGAADTNYCDAALAMPFDPADVEAAIPLLGPSGGWLSVGSVAATIRAGDTVYKVGRTSGATRGTVTFVDATIRMTYDAGYVIFDRQCLTTAMSLAGDSGSLVIGANRTAYGLLMGGSGTVSIFSPLLTVLELFEQRLGTTLALA